jgi:hypothetical protein
MLTGQWAQIKETVHYLAKVETHNHPTAVSPYPGAATGSGGEIRDEGAVGRGSRPKAGLAGFCVSDLLIPGLRQPWELEIGKPHHIASSLDKISFVAISDTSQLPSLKLGEKEIRSCQKDPIRTFTRNLFAFPLHCVIFRQLPLLELVL